MLNVVNMFYDVRSVSHFLFSVLRKILLMEALRRTCLKLYIRSVCIIHSLYYLLY